MSGILLNSLSHVHLLWQGIVILVLIGVCNIGFNIPFVSLVQEFVDSNKIGRVMSFLAFSSLGFMPLSYAILSVLLSAGVSISVILIVCGTIITLFSISLMLWSQVLKKMD